MSKLSSFKLNVGYDSTVVLDNIEIEIENGQILCLMGPNGSGKSTILKTITRHIKKLSGEIILDEVNLDSLKDMERAKNMSVVLTDRISPENMTGFDVVSAGRFPYTGLFGKLGSNDLEKIREAISIVHGENLSSKYFSTMSDGEKQRIMIARAIAQEADIMILDEPTSFLDIRYKIELLNILRTLAKEYNKIIILSLHEVDLIPKIADKVLLITEEGKYLYGVPEEVLSNDRIRKAFSLNRGSFDSLIGNIELPKMDRDDKIFVIPGESKGINIFRILNKKGFSFNAGIVFENDLDYAVAKNLADITISSPSFLEISEDKLTQAKELVDKCRVVIDCGASFTGINKKNAELLKYAIDKEKKVIYIKSRNEYETCPTCSSYLEFTKQLDSL